ncbi:G-protein coupled receptor moody-like isoform X2 [Parasteatoda tepidariorum]|uniref:G-protein coupled receptor moody-like isoform X2 n=1 Tax=Parasteatoda tepidariorum TaxID=114398 RepID=UPI001C719585|nr:G-protein coupled receptor moody-like isoform X2 [Parasteatoda tepidariorum]
MNSTLENITLFSFQTNFSVSNDTGNLGGQERSEMERKLKIARAIFIVLSILGITGNSLSFLALTKSKKLRNATTAFIVNLCVSDMLYCVANLFVFFKPEWNQNSFYCRWFPMFRYWVAGESVYLMIGITVNRFICVVYPKIYRAMYGPIYLSLQIGFTWFYALILALLPFFEVWGRYDYDMHVGLCTVLKLNGKSPKDFFFISAFAFPAIAFAVCYPVIFWVTHKASERVRKSSVVSPTVLNAVSEDVRGKRTTQADVKELKILKMMLVIVVTFIICYFPVAFIKISEKEAQMPSFTLFAYFGVNLSNVINPIIYIVMSAAYRKAYSELFQCHKIWSSLSTSSNAVLIKA